MDNIIKAVISFGIISLVLGTILAAAAKIFAVKVDERIEQIQAILPGANCGGCGFAGCAALAQAIVNGEVPTNSCPVGDETMDAAISKVVGSTNQKKERYRAQVMCSGTNDLACAKYEYLGIPDCSAANRLSGGAKECPNGCLGLGTCKRACKFDAIQIINGVAAVDYEKCKACGACVTSCPKNIIKLIPYESVHWVGCMSHDKGAATKKYCKIGCLGCKLCEKSCDSAAIKVTDFVAEIDYNKCTACNKCESKCPRRVIWSGRSQADEGLVREAGGISEIPDEHIPS